MSIDNKVLNTKDKEKKDISDDNQIRLNLNKITKLKKITENNYIQISESHVLEQLVLLALPSPSRHVH